MHYQQHSFGSRYEQQQQCRSAVRPQRAHAGAHPQPHSFAFVYPSSRALQLLLQERQRSFRLEEELKRVKAFSESQMQVAICRSQSLIAR